MKKKRNEKKKAVRTIRQVLSNRIQWKGIEMVGVGSSSNALEKFHKTKFITCPEEA